LEQNSNVNHRSKADFKILSMSEDTEVLDQDANDQEESGSVEEVVVAAPVEAPKPIEAPKPQEERPTWTMPVAKAQEEKRKAVEKAREEAKAEADASIAVMRAEMEGRLAEAKGLPSYDARLKEVSERHGIDPEVSKDLLAAFKESLPPPPDYSKYDQILKEREIDGYKLKVSNEFDEKVLPLIQRDFPGVTPAHIADVKSKVTDLAFSEGYNTYAIEDIYKVRRDDFEYKNGFSAEASGGRTSELVDFSKMTDKEEHALAERDPQAYGNYLKAMRTNGSRFLD